MVVMKLALPNNISLRTHFFRPLFKATELLNQSWNKPKLRHRSPNVIRMINRFNEVSHWAATSILRVEKVRDRTRVMTKLIRIADVCAFQKILDSFSNLFIVVFV